MPGTSVDFRGRFHVSPPFGWINDPNGFSWYKSEYHLFFQYHPFDSIWGPMHWGHAVSTDLVHWKHLPVALSPTEPYDADGCFSGSAVEKDDFHALIYTGHVDPNPRDASRRREVQCLALGDGIRYTKFSANPVIGPDLLPEDASLADFRDPKVWKEGDDWLCLCASRRKSGEGQLLLFQSLDLERWCLRGTILRGGAWLDGVWECPDYYRMGGRDVLMLSLADASSGQLGKHKSHTAIWSTGRLDREACTFVPERLRELDFGPDFYAPQTVATPDGRRVMIAWMQAWGRSIPTHDLGQGWAGRMTIPREVELVDGNLVQRPVRELERYREGLASGELAFDGLARPTGLGGQILDLEFTLETAGAETVGIKFFVGAEEETLLSWRPDRGELALDRSRGGLPIVALAQGKPDCCPYRAKVETPEGKLFLRVVLDRSSIEVFAGRGEVAMSATVYPRDSSEGIVFFSEGGKARIRFEAWTIL